MASKYMLLGSRCTYIRPAAERTVGRARVLGKTGPTIGFVGRMIINMFLRKHQYADT